MAKSQRVEKAENIALERLDYIMDIHETPDFVEVTGNRGGSFATYRIYDSGLITER